MATIVSTINLKGGVGKTQMTIALAEFLAWEHRKRVRLAQRHADHESGDLFYILELVLTIEAHPASP